MAEPGDRVKAMTNDGSFEGILMPGSNNSVFIKLDSGYNIGIDSKKISSLKVLGIAMKKKGEVKQVKKKNNLPSIAILHTGGTIASKVDYRTGGVSAGYSAEEFLEMFPGLSEIANIETKAVLNIMSEDICFADYVKLANAIEEFSGKCDGIIIGHGTDTLSYTSAALAFMFEKINIPVILVGSQRSSDRGSSDSAMNVQSAARFIASSDFAGIAICMHSSSNDDQCAIFSPLKTRKMHTSRRDAFKAINDTPIALVDSFGKMDFIKKDYSRKSNEKTILKPGFEKDVCLLKTHPNMSQDIFDFCTKRYKAIVIEGTGLGHAPVNISNNQKNYEALKSYIKKGGIVAVTSQCIYGRVHPSVYSNLRRLSEIGCIFCEDMLPETAFIKAAWLLGNYKPAEAAGLLAANLRGEITERSLYEKDFLEYSYKN